MEAGWTFRSGHVAGDTPARLPLSAIRFAPPLRVDNSAPAGRAFTVPVQVQRQPGAGGHQVAKLTVDVSYDGGKTWSKAEVVRSSADGWSATCGTRPAPGTCRCGPPPGTPPATR